MGTPYFSRIFSLFLNQCNLDSASNMPPGTALLKSAMTYFLRRPYFTLSLVHLTSLILLSWSYLLAWLSWHHALLVLSLFIFNYFVLFCLSIVTSHLSTTDSSLHQYSNDSQISTPWPDVSLLSTSCIDGPYYISSAGC